MAMGPGKFDDLLVAALREAGAAEGILLVLGGDKGSGFAACIRQDRLAYVARMLRDVADQLISDAEAIADG